MNPNLHSYLAQAHTDELLREAQERPRGVLTHEQRSWLPARVRRAADRVRRLPDGRPRSEPTTETDVRIRYARPDDVAELGRLAALDSATIPAPPLLVAELDGELFAALSMESSEVIADPFHVTVPLIELLRVRAVQLGGAGAPRRELRSVTRTWSPALDLRRK
jgi:hypothetical protein